MISAGERKYLKEMNKVSYFTQYMRARVHCAELQQLFCVVNLLENSHGKSKFIRGNFLSK